MTKKIIISIIKYINLSLDMDDEDRRRYERSLRKKEVKNYAKTQEAVLDELLPKASGEARYSVLL